LIRAVNGRHLENFSDVITHNYAADGLIHKKFGTLTQNETLMTIGRLKLKPEVELQYGGRSFSETGSSYNSVVE